MIKIITLSVVFICLCFAQSALDIESGVVFSGYNDVKIPRATGTKISLYNQITTDPSIFFRLRYTYTINNRHNISALYAPLSLKGWGIISQPVTFEGYTFPPDTQLQSTYMFNSYRLTYRYDFVQNDKINFGLGFTAKIRDAAITLKSVDTSVTKPNVGFVPIINFNLEWKSPSTLSLILNGDALAAPQGRAEDVMVGLKYNLNPNVDIKFGYRLLEGGADVDEVYNFTLFNYCMLGLIINF